ncbi:hypothetical protein RQP46_002930 [Phenoliferia psychrophenolica]
MPPKLALKPLAGPGPTTLAQSTNSRQEERPTIKTTKEWIIPPRPKPGRKPAQVDPESSRKALNRASQRAFRERRQEYVGELEEKVRLLEQGEGVKSVFFQQQAQAAKKETSSLRVENAALRRILDELRGELAEHRRICGGGGSGVGTGGKGKGKARSVPDDADDHDQQGPAKRLRRPVAAKAPATYVEHSSSDSDMEDLLPPAAVVSPIEDQAPGEPCCGLCSADDSCFCADVGYKIDRTGNTSFAPARRILKVEVEPDFETSQVAIPLRLRKTPGRTPVWAIESARAAEDKPALCNGDPANCPACQNDPFGKAFCNALSESVCSSNPCATCPSNHASTSQLSALPVITAREASPPNGMTDQTLYDALAGLPCCGDPGLCGSLTCAPKSSPSPSPVPALEEDVLLPRSVEPGVRTVDTVPCNEAWTVLKCHPNIAFANLQMLADVVAKRTRCDGPVNMGSPSSLAVPSLFNSPRPIPQSLGLPRIPEMDLTPTLSPHEALVCAADAGQRKRLTVERGAVNEALEYLDRAVGRGGPLKR